jgi:hypothetical protein
MTSIVLSKVRKNSPLTPTGVWPNPRNFHHQQLEIAGYNPATPYIPLHHPPQFDNKMITDTRGSKY